MKKLISVLSLFFALSVSAGNPFATGKYIAESFGTTWYIDPGGNDATGTGAIGNPWKTLYKATNSVSSTGDIIHVNSGTYVETAVCLLAVGVSIEGVDSSSAIIQSTLTADFTAIVRASSAIGTNGNQHISNIKFDGTLTTKWGIFIEGRSNFSIHDISMKDFFNSGIIWDGGINAGEASTYATGNTLYNNRILNCAEYAGGYARGCVCIGSQNGMLIYNNIITQDQRAIGLNGEPIKYWNGGFLKGVQIYNNTLRKKRLYASSGVSDWDFCIEMFMSNGLNVHDNTFINGCIDLAGVFKDTYTYGAWIHDNTFTCDSPNAYRQSAIIVEVLIQDVIIERNTIDNISNGIYLTPRVFDAGVPIAGGNTKNVIIRNNLMTTVVGESGGSFVDFGGGGTNSFDGLYFLNNTCMYKSGQEAFLGISLPQSSSGVIKNIHIKNNIISGSSYSAIYQYAGSTINPDSLEISGNSFYLATNVDTMFLGSGHGTHFVYSSNSHANPTYVGGGNYHLQSGSPLIDAGVNVGLSYFGSAPDIGYWEYGTAAASVKRVRKRKL